MESDFTNFLNGGPDLPTRKLSIGQAAARFDVPLWKVRRLFERGLLPEPERIGVYRLLDEADLPAVEAALLRAGYLKETAHATQATS
jgi:hypothetical protein